MTYRILLGALDADGDLVPSVGGLAVLLGITVREVLDAVGADLNANNLPKHLQQLTIRRLSEARAHTDSSKPAELLKYWAAQRWETRFTITTNSGEIVLVTDEIEVANYFAAEASE